MNFITIFIIIILFWKIIVDFYYLKISKIQIKKMETKEYIKIKKRRRILILIPVLREQNIIKKTLEYFKELKIENIELSICIAGTIREEIENNDYKNKISTKNIVESWITKYNLSKRLNLNFYYSEAKDENGDRASQLNFAVNYIKQIINPDIIGVYDADSLPDENTLYEVLKYYEKNDEIVCQQPVHFIKAANRMAKDKKNPILIANALYQTTWTLIRELPRWTLHSKSKNLFKRNDYLIGHGEFLSYKLYKQFKFPENEVTDGIQLGYRISMSGKIIVPLNTFCEDQVPQKISQLISQHKRWFGGCMKLKSAYDWSKLIFNKKAVYQLLDGYWSQYSWAYASIFISIGLFLSLQLFFKNQKIYFWIISILILIYCYLIPFIAHKLIPIKIKVRLIDWICLPIAIFIKGIGPNLYFFEKILCKIINKKIKYSKVER